MQLYIDSDNLIILDQLTNSDGQLIDDAEVTASVHRYDGLLIAEDISLISVGAGTGQYKGILADDAAALLKSGTYYDLKVVAERGEQVKTTFQCRLPAKYLCAC